MKKPGRPLKVYRTSTGFHDAYVAAPSKKAALAAWGAGKDLFAIGSAEIVTDPALTAEPLANPGRIVKRSRGNLAVQLAAMPAEKERGASARKPKSDAHKTKPKPPPSRARLDAAEAAVQAFEDEASAAMAALRRREEELRQERQALDRRHAATAEKLERALAQARERYERALAEWRRSG